MAARIEAVRQLYEGRLSDKELYELVAAYSTRRSGLPVKPAGIREIDRKFSTDHDRRWLKRNLKRFQDRVPDLLPSIEELEKIQLGKIKI